MLCGLRGIICGYPEFAIIAERGCVESALAAFGELTPDIAVIVHSPPRLDGLVLLRHLHEAGVRSRVLLVVPEVTWQVLTAALELGVGGLLAEGADPAEVLACLGVLASGQTCLPQERIAGPEPQPEPLSPRQREIALMVARGMTNKEIAAALDLAEGTVKLHLHRIFRRLRIGNRAALAVAVSGLSQTDAPGAA